MLESRLYSEEEEGWSRVGIEQGWSRVGLEQGWSRVGLEQGGSRWAGVDTAWDIELELCSGCELEPCSGFELEPCSGFELEPSPGWDEFSVLSIESLKSRAGVDP